MLRNLNEVRGYDIVATDGELGKATDFYFDDRSWCVRYLVVDTGWLFGREVLLGPEAVNRVDMKDEAIPVSLSKQQIEESPDIGADPPVSKQEELMLRRHYGWPSYWDVYPATFGMAPAVATLQPAEADAVRAMAADRDEPGVDIHLRSVNEVGAYDIAARDGEIGDVTDFIVEDDTWSIRYLVVDTGKWLPGRKVLLSLAWADGIDWSKRQVRFDLTRQEIEDSPAYDPKKPVERDYEIMLHRHLGRIGYWQ